MGRRKCEITGYTHDDAENHTSKRRNDGDADEVPIYVFHDFPLCSRNIQNSAAESLLGTHSLPPSLQA
jgi:hypothetical protein